MPWQSNTWTSMFGALIQAHDLAGAISCLDALKTGHANIPPQAVKDKAVKLIRETYGSDTKCLYEAGMALVRSKNDAAKEIGICLLPPFYESATAVINEQLIHVGDDPNWEVREWAASALAHVISGSFDLVYPSLREWTTHPSSNIRRMVIVASGYAMRDCTVAQCRRLVDLLTPLLADTDAYVSKNLGPFALGSYAIRDHADLVARWACRLDRRDERTAWNLAMMFTTAEASRQLEALGGLLRLLACDDRKRVKSAVRKAMANLEKRNRPAVMQMLQVWTNASNAEQEPAAILNTHLSH